MSKRRDPNSARGVLERAMYKVLRGGGSATVKRRKCGEARMSIIASVLGQRPELKRSTVCAMLSHLITEKYGPPESRNGRLKRDSLNVPEPHNGDFEAIRRKGYEGWTATQSGLWVFLDYLTPGVQPCYRIAIAETCFRLLAEEGMILGPGRSKRVEIKISEPQSS